VTGQGPERGQLAARLRDMATDIAAAAEASPPAPVLLAHACRGFVVAGVVSSLLNQHAVPRRDNFAVCDEYCDSAVGRLTEVLGEHLLRRYSAGARREDFAELARNGTVELPLSTDADIDRIADAMITLGATLRDMTTPIADNEDLPPLIRGAARMSADTAQILWSHFGGDSGGR
jgi:hypothetical protein